MLRAALDAWSRASVREQRLVVLAAVVVLGAIGWLVLWQPMQADTTRLLRDLPRERAVLAAAQAQAADIVALRKAAAAVRAPLAPSVERALATAGLRADAGTFEEKDARVRVNLASVRFDTLVSFLDGLAREAGVRVVDATLTQRVEPGFVRAELVLAR